MRNIKDIPLDKMVKIYHHTDFYKTIVCHKGKFKTCMENDDIEIIPYFYFELTIDYKKCVWPMKIGKKDIIDGWDYLDGDEE